jgi:hypothetical protein
MNGSPPPEALEVHRRRIEAFVRRARRVEAHSLLAELRRLQRWAEGTTEIRSIDGVLFMTQDVPPEEAFESLASRCRPFLLQGDPIHWASIFKSLRAFVASDEVFGPALESLRGSWTTALSPGPDTGFAVSRADEVADDAVWFATLADSWLYGDLVHADPKAQAKAAGHTLNSRYSAAVLLYGQVAIHVIATLNFIRQAHASGLLSLDEKSFEGPVTANVPMRFQVAAMVQADVGTEPQMMLDLLDEARANQRVTRTDEAGHNTDPGEG